MVTQSVPKIAIAPLLVIAFGANALPRIIVTFLVAFFPLVISIAAGLLATPADLVELGRALKANRFQQLVRSDAVKARLASLFAQGLQTRGPLELDLGDRIGAI